MIISHNSEFTEAICNEKWRVGGGVCSVVGGVSDEVGSGLPEAVPSRVGTDGEGGTGTDGEGGTGGSGLRSGVGADYPIDSIQERYQDSRSGDRVGVGAVGVKGSDKVKVTSKRAIKEARGAAATRELKVPDDAGCNINKIIQSEVVLNPKTLEGLSKKETRLLTK